MSKLTNIKMAFQFTIKDLMLSVLLAFLWPCRIYRNRLQITEEYYILEREKKYFKQNLKKIKLN